ncbi:hypothetical protein [Streptomyces sp. NBC_00102]|nr:hypothetical protein [Streptomyces sp. NBC_00102]MCX5398526.1 hypothetical protein [Streptomyces sp. NBC_00102]
MTMPIFSPLPRVLLTVGHATGALDDDHDIDRATLDGADGYPYGSVQRV